MSRTTEINTNGVNGHDNFNTTTIQRTLVEHGLRPVGSNADGLLNNTSAIAAKSKLHQDEKTEMQKLNYKFAAYLDHVQSLENFNGQLAAELEALKRKIANDTHQFDLTNGLRMQSFRDELDDGLRNQIYFELQAKRYESDVLEMQTRIAALEEDSGKRLDKAQQELNLSISVLEQLKQECNRYEENFQPQRTTLNNLSNEFDALQGELVDHQLERIMIENELQTLREQVAFQNALYQAQRKDLLSLNAPSVDLSTFYHTELVRAITEIRHDFEILARSQITDLEEYYRIKTEEIQEIARENERKRLLANQNNRKRDSVDADTLADLENDYQQLQSENNQLETEINYMMDDLTRMEDEHTRDNQKLDEQYHQLQQDLANKKAIIDGALENNVSLRFELSTYRALLNSETERLNRSSYEEKLEVSPSQLDKSSSTTATLPFLLPTRPAPPPPSSSTSVLSSIVQASSVSPPPPSSSATPPQTQSTSVLPSLVPSPSSAPELLSTTPPILLPTRPAPPPPSLSSSSSTGTSVSPSVLLSTRPPPPIPTEPETSVSPSVLSSTRPPPLIPTVSVTSETPSSPEVSQDNLSQNNDNYTKQKMKITTTSTDPIIIGLIDLINDCIVITHNRATNKSESLGNWTVRRQVDQQPEIIYKFPPSLVLKPGRKIRILSKRSPQSTSNSSNDELLFADNIETWGCGQVMKTTLTNNLNEEVGAITQTCLPE